MLCLYEIRGILTNLNNLDSPDQVCNTQNQARGEEESQRRQHDLSMSLEGQSSKFCVELLPMGKIDRKPDAVLL